MIGIVIMQLNFMAIPFYLEEIFCAHLYRNHIPSFMLLSLIFCTKSALLSRTCMALFDLRP